MLDNQITKPADYWLDKAIALEKQSLERRALIQEEGDENFVTADRLRRQADVALSHAIRRDDEEHRMAAMPVKPAGWSVPSLPRA